MTRENQSPAERAERLQRKRIRIMVAEAVLFLALQANYFTTAHPAAEPLRRVEGIRISAMVVMSIVLLLLIGAGGGWFAGKEVRALMEDETTVDHRRRALAAGFWATMVAVLALSVLGRWARISLDEAMHVVLSVGIAVPLLRFAHLERRAFNPG